MVAPDGTQFTANIKSQPIAVLKPSVTNWGITEGYVQPGTENGFPSFGLYGDPKSSFTDGMAWHDVAVSIPAPFSGVAGSLCDFAQLIEPDRESYIGNTETPFGQPDQIAKNGLIGLDGALPYSTGGFGSGWSPPAPGSNGDHPPIFITAPGDPWGYTQLSANDTFTTWVIYRPPANGTATVWIPLQEYSWAWSEQLTWVSNQ